MGSTEDETRMRVALKESVQRTYEKATTLRPKNTQRAYGTRQQEFLDWCSGKGAAFNNLTRFTVTGEKLHLFLEERVIGRAKRHKSGNEHSDRIEKVGRSTVNSYVAAMVDLWKQQSRAKVNSNPSPRDEAVTALLKLTQYEEDERKRKNFEDRGANTLLDGYTTIDQIKEIARYFWAPARDSGKSLRNLVAFLLSHYALMRGESARMMELADLHSIILENEGYTPCRALVMVMRQGKTNQVGRIEVGACMRSKNVEICPHGMLGFYLFWRWHVDGEVFPDFTSPERWFPIKLLKTGNDSTKPMSYKVHNEAITAALKHVGIHSKAKTHVGRGSGSRMADLGGASESQIRRLGRWNNQSMEKCYLTSLPREAMRTLAGFEPTKGSFFVARASVDPPVSLQNMVFPQVEVWQQAINEEKAEQSLAAGGFLELLQYLRKVVLQDAVFLQKSTPTHPIWKHSIFQSPEFAQFRNETMQAVDTMEDPAEQRLQKAVPVLNAKIDGVHQDLKSSLAQVCSTMRTVQGSLSDVMHVLAPLRGGTAVVQVQLISGDRPTGGDVAQAVASSTSTTSGERRDIPMYKLRRGLVTVPELWNEWSVGIDGARAVRDLEDQFGTKWCGADERRFFNRRRPIYSLVVAIADHLCTVARMSDIEATNQAVQALEEYRRTNNKTLNWIAKHTSGIKDDVQASAVARCSVHTTNISNPISM